MSTTRLLNLEPGERNVYLVQCTFSGGDHNTIVVGLTALRRLLNELFFGPEGASTEPQVADEQARYDKMVAEFREGGDSFSETGEDYALLVEWINDAMTLGAALIVAERERQIHEKGYTVEHDDQHEDDELSIAALHYVEASTDTELGIAEVLPELPEDWHCGKDLKRVDCTHEERIAYLMKAGALLASEIDRLVRDLDRNVQDLADNAEADARSARTE
jgi:hypothetical protein